MGHPIIPATGEKVLTHSDYEGAGPHGLGLVRSFRSSRVVGAMTGAATAGLGQTWSHNHAASLRQEGTAGAAGSSAKVLLGDGSVRAFNWDVAASSWKPTNSADALTANGAGLLYKRLDDDGAWQFDMAGKLLTVTQRNGWVSTYTYGNASAPGQLTQVTNQFGQSLRFNYDAAGLLTSVLYPDGQTSVYAYDTLARLVSVIQPGSTSGTVSKSYLYENTQFPQLLTGIIDEAGNRLASYAYDSQGRGILTEHAGGADRHTIAYGASTGAPVTVTDPLGTQRSYSYSTSLGKLAVTAASLPSGSGAGDAASRVQDANGFVTQETDFLGVSTLYTWDINRRLPLSTTQAAGRPEAQTTSTQWHPSFRLPVLLSEAGRSTAYTYDSLGNKLTETLTDTATGQTRAWAWTYNAQGLVATETAPNGGVSQYGYDVQGQLTRVTNPLGQVTQLAYDTAGRLAQQTAPNGLLSSYSHDARGRLLTQVRGGEASRYSYTSTGQLASASLPSGLQLSYRYDAAQRLTGALDNRGNSVNYTLDAMGNRMREEVKDANGNIALATTRIINSLNRIAAIQGAAGQTTALAFDANGEASSATDPLNQTTRQSLDALRRPVSTTLADNTTASQAWNTLNQLTQASDPKGIATRYQRNAFGEVMAETSPDIGSLSYQRDAAGQVISQTDAKGNTTQITRDALGRPTEIRHSANHITRYSWDQGGTGSQIGYLSKIDDNSGSTSYERDPWGRITGKTQTVNDNPNSPSSFTTRYSYQGGELAGISYPSGLKVIYRRNASGQISGLETQEPYSNPKRPSLPTPFLSNLSYTALGQPKAWSWGNGDAASRVFDADGRMASNEFASYSFDAASRITGITQSLWASRTANELYQTPLNWSVSYDNRNRLTGFHRAGAQTSYSYDANSNRLTAIDQTSSDTDLDGGIDADDFSQTSSQALNIEASSNRLLGFSQTHSKAKGSKTLATTSSLVSYSLDANGNLTSDGLRSLAYDEANRLEKVKLLQGGEEASIRYLHNALGQRVFKGEPQAESYQPNEAELGQDFIAWLKKNFQWLFARAQADSSLGTAYVYGDGQLPEWAVLGDYDNGSAAGKGRTEYLWLPTEAGDAIPVGMYRSGKFFAIHTDHLGTPRLITNEQNRPVWQWPYSAFGNNQPTGVLKATANPKAAMTNQPVLLRATKPGAEFDLRYPGQMADSEAGQFYNYFRSYLPGMGRYTQADPIGLDGGLNRFSYVSADPLSKTDPSGLLEHFMMELNAKGDSSLECGCRESYSAFSGNPPYRNNPDATNVPSHGPAPEGWYYIVGRPAGGLGGRAMSFMSGKDEWFALYRNDGTPGDDTTERGVSRTELRLHPKGPMGNSFGCVTLNNKADYDRLRKRLLSTSTGVIPGTSIKYYGTILLYRPSLGW